MKTLPRLVAALSCSLVQAACMTMTETAICSPGDHACVNRKVQAQAGDLQMRTFDMPQAAPAESAARPEAGSGNVNRHIDATQKPSPQAPAERRNPQRYSAPLSVSPVTPAPAPAPNRPPAIAVPQTVVKPPPSPVTSCDAGGCWSGGERYQGGAGNTYLDNTGKPCQRMGAWIQCF